ncbi:hypothetical protein [Amaricoccus macauensis]|uniref:hypothetical protein n=1 Tax=Amaricoccus macauensis TaxID=57001 RepID=UPI003C7D4AEB
MQRFAVPAALAAAVSLSGTMALADCQAELDSFLASSGAGEAGLSGLGSGTIDALEPSSGESAEAGTAETGSLDGDLAELEAQNEELAREMDATESDLGTGGSDGGPDDTSAAIQEARDALAAGDEQGCMSALDKARGL